MSRDVTNARCMHLEVFALQVISRSAVALAVGQEALRMKPLASMLFRQTTEDVAVGGLAVPEGTVIALCPKKVRRRHQCVRNMCEFLFGL